MAPRLEELIRSVQDSVGGSGGGETARNAFVYLATGAKGASIAAALFVALAASSAVAGEAHSGAIRLLLCRPVSRGAVFVGKAACLAVFALTLLFLGFGAAAAGAAVVSDFGAVRVVIEKSSAGEMFARTGFAFFLAALGCLSVLGFALAVSVASRAASAATSATFGILLGFVLLVFVVETLRPYFFVSYVTSPFDTLRAHALGQDAPRPVWFGLPTLHDWADITFAIALPALSAALCFLVAARLFVKKDWLA
jgi:ABC-type transport system involved in multi-copper enzyme maturation permease subunit